MLNEYQQIFLSVPECRSIIRELPIYYRGMNNWNKVLGHTLITLNPKP